MKIATFNVNGINARLPALLHWLAKARPDVVCLQELKTPQEKFPVLALRDAGYQSIWHGQVSWNGVAILAKKGGLVETRRGLPGDPADLHSRYIEATIDGLTVACLYVPNGNPAPGVKFSYKLKWLQRLHTHAQELIKSGVPTVLTGDFNIIPTDLDVYAPERWRDDALFRPEVRKAYQRLLAQGWIDVLRELHPDERVYTFWKFLRNAYARDAGLRIDHFLITPALRKCLVSCSVERSVRAGERPSDHAPVLLELALPKAAIAKSPRTAGAARKRKSTSS